MAKKMNTFTEAQVQAIVAKAVAEALAGVKKPTTTTKGKGKAKLVEFTKHDGTVVKCTQAQADAWTKYRDGYTDRVASKEANLAKFEADRKAYKPSQALIKAIKADRASITLAVAKAQYGFVGTKPDLKALKDKVCK